MTDTPTLKRLKDSHQMSRYLRLGVSNGNNKSWDRLEIVLRHDTVTFTQMYSTYRQKDVEVGTDLKTLVALFVASILPAGVLADRLDEDHPDLSWASEFLRKWDNAEGAV